MLKKILFLVSTLAVARAQIPGLGFCPEYVPMTNFNISKYLGAWYEVERNFQLAEVASRCTMVNYTKGSDGKLRVSNEVTNRITNYKRVFEGEIKPPASKADEGKLHVKYSVALTPDATYSVLDTDYKNYAVLWSCSTFGLFKFHNAWLMFRERKPAGEAVQQAYGILDKYNISKTLFVKTNQDDCTNGAPVSVEPAESTEKPAVAEAVEEEPVEEVQEAKNVVNLRIVPDAPAIIIETKKAELGEAAEKPAVEAAEAQVQPEAAAQVEAKPEVPSSEPVEAVDENKEEFNSVEKAVEAEVPPPAPVAEVILKAADRANEVAKEPTQDTKQFQPLQFIQEAFVNPAAQIPEALAKPVAQFQEAIAKPVAQFQEAIAKPVSQIQEAFAKPVAQFQETFHETFGTPLQNLQQAFHKPTEKNPEAIEKPLEVVAEHLEKPVKTIEEALNVPAVNAATEKLLEVIKEKEAAPKEEEKKEEEKRIES